MRGDWHEEARALRSQGVSISKIARRFGVTPGAVRYAVCPDVRERAVERARHRREELRVHPKPSRTAWHARAVAMALAGKTIPEIAREVGRHREGVRKVIVREVPRDRIAKAPLGRPPHSSG